METSDAAHRVRRLFFFFLFDDEPSVEKAKAWRESYDGYRRMRRDFPLELRSRGADTIAVFHCFGKDWTGYQKGR